MAAPVYEALGEHGITKERLDTVLAPKADRWGELVHAFEVLTVLSAVQMEWPCDSCGYPEHGPHDHHTYKPHDFRP